MNTKCLSDAWHIIGTQHLFIQLVFSNHWFQFSLLSMSMHFAVWICGSLEAEYSLPALNCLGSSTWLVLVNGMLADVMQIRCEAVQFSCSVMSVFLWPHGLQHARLPCPSPVPGACSNSCPSSRWCFLTISSSVIPFSSCLQSFPASESFPMSQFFTSSGQSIKTSASASFFPMNNQD